MKQTTENATIVNGVVLTDKAAEILKGWQEDNNGIIADIREGMADAALLLLYATKHMDEEFTAEAMEVIDTLNMTRSDLKQLMKP